MIATSEEGSFQEGNKLHRGVGSDIRDTPLRLTCELCGSEKGVQVEGETRRLHAVPVFRASVGFHHVVNWCETWTGMTKLRSSCTLPIFIVLIFSPPPLLGLQEDNRTICSYQECSPKPVFPPSLPDAMILVKEINSFTGCDT